MNNVVLRGPTAKSVDLHDSVEKRHALLTDYEGILRSDGGEGAGSGRREHRCTKGQQVRPANIHLKPSLCSHCKSLRMRSDSHFYGVRFHV